MRGYPTICYFEKGQFLFQYDNYGATAEDIVEWLKNPQPPQPQVPETPWADEGGSVYHLTDEDFDQFVKEHASVLVMFHAPWCGHCKKMKPEFEKAAEVLHGDADSSGVLAAVDATVNKGLAERFHISEFPTLKYFKNGEKHEVPALRTKKKFIEWMQNPEAPPPPEPTWEEQQTSVLHLAGDSFRETLKKKKHTLVMFYAPGAHTVRRSSHSSLPLLTHSKMTGRLPVLPLTASETRTRTCVSRRPSRPTPLSTTTTTASLSRSMTAIGRNLGLPISFEPSGRETWRNWGKGRRSCDCCLRENVPITL